MAWHIYLQDDHYRVISNKSLEATAVSLGIDASRLSGPTETHARLDDLYFNAKQRFTLDDDSVLIT